MAPVRTLPQFPRLLHSHSPGPSKPCALRRGSRHRTSRLAAGRAPRSQRHLCTDHAPLSGTAVRLSCPAIRTAAAAPARGRSARGAAARTCCCPPRRALCRDARGADVTVGVIINDLIHLFIYLLVCLFAYLIIYLFPFHGAPLGRLRACAYPCPPFPGIRACGGGLGGE